MASVYNITLDCLKLQISFTFNNITILFVHGSEKQFCFTNVLFSGRALL